MRTDVTVHDVMNREFVGVSESDTLEDAAELMRAEAADVVVVLRGSEPIGSLTTATALAGVLDGDPTDRPVRTVMEPSVPTVEPDASLARATHLLLGRDTAHLLVVSDDGVVGLLTDRDVLAAGDRLNATASASQSASMDDGETIAPTQSPDTDADATANDSFQSICEVCGSLTPELSAVNGQLVCPACQEY